MAHSFRNMHIKKKIAGIKFEIKDGLKNMINHQKYVTYMKLLIYKIMTWNMADKLMIL